jgi:hypothetical protein
MDTRHKPPLAEAGAGHLPGSGNLNVCRVGNVLTVGWSRITFVIAEQHYQCNNFASPTGFDVDTTNICFQAAMKGSVYSFS